jgi:DNA-binding CsgD family transcriptional regulator
VITFTGRQTFAAEAQAEYPRQHVPEHVAAQYSIQSREFACRDLAREGFAPAAIAAALGIDVKLVRRIIGADL